MRVLTKLVGVAVAALAIVTSMTTVSAAGADTPFPARVLSDSLGVNTQFLNNVLGSPSPAQKDAAVATMAGQGIRVARVMAEWSLIEPNAPDPVTGHTYDWTSSDEWMTTLATNGVRAAPVLIGTPWWDSPIGTADQFNNVGSRTWVPIHPEYYGAFAGAFAARYGPGGEFWTSRPGIVALPPLTYEIWNEPNVNGRLTNAAGGSCPLHTAGIDQGPKHYAVMYMAARTAVRAAHPGAVVLVGGLASAIVPGSDDRCTVQEFVAGMKMHSSSVALDAIAVHVYKQTAAEAETHLEAVRRVIDDLGWPRFLPLYLNEVGWVTSGSAWATTDEERGANLAQVTDTVLRSKCGVRQVAVHTWLTPEVDVANPEHWYGIANIDGTTKRSADMYSATVKQLQGEGTSPASSATTPLCPWRPEPDMDGDGLIDIADSHPADPSRGADDQPPVVPEAPTPLLLLVGVTLALGLLVAHRDAARGRHGRAAT